MHVEMLGVVCIDKAEKSCEIERLSLISFDVLDLSFQPGLQRSLARLEVAVSSVCLFP